MLLDGIVDLDRRWRFFDTDPDAPNGHVLTEEQILREYWPYWYSRMCAVNKRALATPGRCIEDWVVVNWASQEISHA